MKKKSSNVSDNLRSSSWNRIQKRAHEVWDMGTEGDRVLALRKKEDTARISEETHQTGAQGLQELLSLFSDGDNVLLYMGGRKIEAQVLNVEDGKVNLIHEDGVLTDIPQEWCRAAQVAKCRCKCGCTNSADGSLGKCKSCLMTGCE